MRSMFAALVLFAMVGSVEAEGRHSRGAQISSPAVVIIFFQSNWPPLPRPLPEPAVITEHYVYYRTAPVTDFTPRELDCSRCGQGRVWSVPAPR